MIDCEATLAYARARLYDIGGAMLADSGAMTCTKYYSRERVAFDARMRGAAERLPEHTRAWTCLRATLPPDAKGRAVVAEIRARGYRLIYSAEGVPMCATDSLENAYARICDKALGGEDAELWLECPADEVVAGRLCIVNESLRRLYFDMQVMCDLAENLPDGSVRRIQICRALAEALNVLYDISDECAPGAVYALKPELERTGGDYGLSVIALGEARIDAGRADAIDRACAAFANALALMQRCDGYVFSLNQAYLYDMVKRAQPEVYARVRERVSQGRIEPLGGWCVQYAGTASGETIVRALIMGKRFYARELAQDVNVMRIPSGAAMPAQLPQIMLLSGMNYALCDGAASLGFWWQGLNGARVLAHTVAPQSDTQCALPGGAMRVAREFAAECPGEETIMPFGGADAPDETHMERILREGALRGVPPVRGGRAADFFERLRLSRVELPVYTYDALPSCDAGAGASDIEAIMRARRMERTLYLSEIMFSALSLRGVEYPRADIAAAWQALFRVNAPGGRADAEAQAHLRDCEGALNALIDQNMGEGLDVVINPHAWTVDMWLPPTDECAPGEAMRISLPPLSATSATRAKQTALPPLRADESVLENDRLRLSFDERGYLAGIRDVKAGYDVLRGAGNQLSVYEDDGDARRIGARTFSRRAGGFTQTGVRACIEGAKCRRIAQYSFGASTLTQTIEITAGSARVDFITEIDWHERGRLLRAEFPLGISAGRLLYATEFGHITRAVSGGGADFTAQGWASLEQTGRGAALISDGGYGYSYAGNMLALDVIRSCRDLAEDGLHTIRYALYPHSCDAADIARQAALFCHMPIVRPGLTFGPLCWLDAAGVMLDAVKVSEDGGDIVIRMHECLGASVRASLRTGFEAAAASVCDLMERITAPLSINDGGVLLEFAPFEIKTVIISSASKTL